ncbi:hypothetical protein D6C78_11054, partial [Aureobasidium pullulans]
SFYTKYIGLSYVRKVRDRVDVLIVSLVNLDVSFEPFYPGIKSVFSKYCLLNGGVLVLANDGVNNVNDDQDGGVRLDTFETVRTALPYSFSPYITSSCSSYSPRPPSSRPSSSAALIHQDMIMASLSGNHDLRNIDWIRLALVEGRYHVHAWERLQVDWPSQDNNLECNHAAPWTGPDGKAVGVVTPISYHEKFSSPGVLLCEDARSPDCPKTRDNRLKNEKHRQKPAKQRRNAERAGKREEYGLAQQQLAQKGVSQL